MSNKDIDTKKRQTLKVLSGTAVIATSAPALAASIATSNIPTSLANNSSVNALTPAKEAEVAEVVLGSGAELTITLQVDSQPMIEISNNTDRLVIVRHVYPGIVHAGKVAFDINAVFAKSAYAVGAGRSRRVQIHPVQHTQAEAYYPRARHANEPQRLVTVVGSDSNGPIVNSSRSFYA